MHVLCAPPAFILSQDQTLMFIVFWMFLFLKTYTKSNLIFIVVFSTLSFWLLDYFILVVLIYLLILTTAFCLIQISHYVICTLQIGYFLKDIVYFSMYFFCSQFAVNSFYFSTTEYVLSTYFWKFFKIFLTTQYTPIFLFKKLKFYVDFCRNCSVF